MVDSLIEHEFQKKDNQQELKINKRVDLKGHFVQ